MKLRPASLLLAVLGTTSACGGDNRAPFLAPIEDRRAVVDVELTVPLRAQDPDADPLRFTLSSPTLQNLPARTRVDGLPDGGTLHWTPLLSDVGEHEITVTVSDGAIDFAQTFSVSVASEDVGFGAPVFVQPLGTGATLDLRKTDCIVVPLAVEDADSPGVTLAQEEPIENAELVQEAERTGSWTFCPSKEQLAAQNRLSATFSADDFENEKTLKPYLIVLRGDDGESCPGEAPVITHTPENVTGAAALTVVAEVSDELGIKFEPLFYYSETDPGPEPDLGQMTQLTMVRLEGDDQAGTWGAEVPNPVAGAPAGSSATLYYVIVAQDDDDPEGACDHTTESPVYEMTVDNPEGTGGGKTLCETCATDAECGDGSDDLCVAFDGARRCFAGCENDSECPQDHYCSITQLSGTAASGRQCIPESFTCETAPPSCTDDSYEDNDTRPTASPLALGTYTGLKSCPATVGDDEDWYEVTLTASSQLDVIVAGGTASDLDVGIYDANGALLDVGNSLSSTEVAIACVPAGTYYVRVYAFGAADNSYDLDVSATADSCGMGGPTCTDDGNEDDDGITTARQVSLPGPYTSTTQAICSMDDDWYEVFLFNGETIYAELTFGQSNASEDLDVYIYDSQGNNLTGCTEQTPSGCNPNNGQSVTSDESAAWNILQAGTFFIVVHGWNGAENLYDICLGLSPTACP